jgi:hypothetical protein
MRTALEITPSVEEVSDADDWGHSPKEMEIAMRLIAAVFQDDPHAVLTADGVKGILEKAWAAQGELYGPEQARLWATNELGVEFQFSAEMKARDGAELTRLNGDLEQLTALRQSVLRDNRVNSTRVEGLEAAGENDEDMARAREIATQGMRLFTVPEFIPCPHPPQLRQSYIDAAPAVNKMMAEMWEEGKLLLLPTEQVKRIPGVHFSPMSWAPKADKKEGRPIGDLSSPRGGAVNCDAAADLVREAWGPIQLPTLSDIVLMILQNADEHGWNNIELWKMDLKGAFTLINFRPDNVKWLAFELTDGITAVHIVGMFGWCGCPFGFAVFSRLLISMVSRALGRNGLMYVDDVCMAGPIASGAQDRTTASRLIEEVMGPGSISPKKTEFGRKLDMIGWSIDLDQRLVSLSEKNLFKTLFAFFSVDLNKGVSLPVLQALASRASRASLLSTAMQPYTRGMFRAMTHYNGHRSTLRKLTGEAKFEVLMWRAFLVQLMWAPAVFARELESFRPTTTSDFLLECDASLSGIGISISRKIAEQQGGIRHEPWTHWGGPLPFGERTGRGKSGQQNLCELAAILTGLLVLRQEGCRDFTVDVKGDNTASLSWLKSGRVTSSLARNASIGLSLLLVHMGCRIGVVDHVAGVLNEQMDGLSRGKASTEMGLPIAQRSPWLNPGEWAWDYLFACAPSLEEEGSVNEDSMGVVRQFINKLRVPPPTVPKSVAR